MALDFNTNTDNNPVWLTPPSLIKSLGDFDLDPCACTDRPWDTAKNHYIEAQDGLSLPWEGRVWLNPPYGYELVKWLEKMSQHLNGTALIYARTDVQALHKFLFPFADSLLFMEGRVKFHHADGTPAKTGGNAPSMLVGYSEYDSDMLEKSGIKGFHIPVRQRILIAGISIGSNKTWRITIGEVMEELSNQARLDDIYQAVVRMSPEKVRNNPNYKAKIRQQLRMHFTRIGKGMYSLN